MKLHELRFTARLPKSSAALAIIGLLCAGPGLFADSASAAGPADPKSPAPAATAAPAEATGDQAAAKDEKKEKEKEEKVVKGVIASNGRYGQFASVAVQTAGSSPGDEGGVISGSVSFVKEGVCRAVITNNGEKSYSVYFAVVGVDGRGAKVFSSTGSGTVEPKKSLTKEVFGCRKDLNLALELRSAKALK